MEETRKRINFEIEYSKVRIIRQNGGMTEFLRLNREQALCLSCSTEDLAEGRTAICMDEGVPRKKGDFATAGSLACMIFANPSEEKGWEGAAYVCRKANIRKIIGHDGCSGMRMAYSHLYGERAAAVLSEERLNSFTRDLVKDMAAGLSKMVGWPIVTCHHGRDKMYRPGYHVATSAYFCNLQKGFNPGHRFPAMPLGYLINSWGYQDLGLAVQELAMAVDISLRSYAGLLGPERPFAIYVVGRGLTEQIRIPLFSQFGGQIFFDQVEVPR